MPSVIRPSRSQCLWLLAEIAIAALAGQCPLPAYAQAPAASSYSTRDGRIGAVTITCPSIDGTYRALPCGVSGTPLHVMVDGGATSGSATSSVTQSGAWSVAVSNLPATQPVSGAVSVSNLPATQAISAASLPLPAGAATAANQPALNADGGALVHLTNLPAILTVSDANSAAFQGVIPITPGTAVAAQRSVGFVITAAGNATFTMADGSTLTLALPAATSFQSLPFAVTNVTLGSGTAGSFWNLK